MNDPCALIIREHDDLFTLMAGILTGFREIEFEGTLAEDEEDASSWIAEDADTAGMYWVTDANVGRSFDDGDAVGEYDAAVETLKWATREWATITSIDGEPADLRITQLRHERDSKLRL